MGLLLTYPIDHHSTGVLVMTIAFIPVAVLIWFSGSILVALGQVCGDVSPILSLAGPVNSYKCGHCCE